MRLFINANRNGYSPEQCKDTMTVGKLIRALEDYDENTPVFLKHDNGYTYGSISYRDFEDGDEADDEESEEE